jgi:hypothetical protein
MTEPIAEFRDHDSLRDALRLARERRNLSLEALDELGGLARGHGSKILALGGSRKLTIQTLTWLLGGLACKCVLVNDPEALEQIKGRLKPRNTAVVRRPSHAELTKRLLARLGARGGKLRWQNVPPTERRRLTQRAANARWHGQVNGGGQ